MTYASAVEIHAGKIMDVMRTMETPLTNGEIVDLLDKQYISTINYDVTCHTSLALNKLVADGKIERLSEKKAVMTKRGVVRRSPCYQVLNKQVNPVAPAPICPETIELNGVKYVALDYYHKQLDAITLDYAAQMPEKTSAKVRQISDQRGLNGYHALTLVVDYCDQLAEIQPGDVIGITAEPK